MGITRSNVLREDALSERNLQKNVKVRPAQNAQNVKVRPGIPYIGQYTNLFIFQFVFLHCLAVLTTFNTLVNILWIILVNILWIILVNILCIILVNMLSTSYLDTTVLRGLFVFLGPLPSLHKAAS